MWEQFGDKGLFVKTMNFASAVKVINNLLNAMQPQTFGSTWILHHAPHAYRFIQKNIRTETGAIDWDRFTRELDRRLQKKWYASRRGRRAEGYRDKKAVEIILKKYQDKLYTFLSPLDKHDKEVRDIISITLVRIAQKGNTIAKQELAGLLRLTIDGWIEESPRLACWQGLDEMIQTRIEGCIRRYRYSGSFIRYLFKTLEYAGRGLRPVVAYSLDDFLCSGEKRRSDRIAQDAETGEIVIYR